MSKKSKKPKQHNGVVKEKGQDTILASLGRAQARLRDPTEQGHLGGLIRAIHRAEKWTADRASDRVIMSRLFDELTPGEVYNRLRDDPEWQNGTLNCWIEVGPIEGQGRDGLLLLKKAGENHFTFYQVGNAPFAEVQKKHGSKLIKHLAAAEHLVSGHTSVDKVVGYVNTHLLAPCLVDLDENGLICHRMNLEGLPVMRDLNAASTKKIKNEMEATYQAKAQRSSVYLLRLLYLMISNGALRLRPADSAAMASSEGRAFRAFALGQPFLTRFNALKEPDDLRRLLNLPTQAEQEQRPILEQFGPIKNDPSFAAEDPAQIVRTFVADVRMLPHIICDQAFCDLTRTVASTLAPQKVADLLAVQGTLFPRFWFEIPFMQEVPAGDGVVFAPRLGALVETRPDGRALALRLVDTARTTKRIPASQLLSTKAAKLPDVGINFHLDPRIIAFDRAVSYDDEASTRMTFLAAALLLTRAHADGLVAAGVDVPWAHEGMRRDRVQGVCVREGGKKKNNGIVIDGKSRARLKREEREIMKLTEEAVAWEAVKQDARETHGALVTKDNHGLLMEQLDRAAKEMFGDAAMAQYGRNVTVQLSNVRESIPIANRVNPGTHRHPAHMRITLMWEDKPSEDIRTVRRAMYRVTTQIKGTEGGDVHLMLSARMGQKPGEKGLVLAL